MFVGFLLSRNIFSFIIDISPEKAHSFENNFFFGTFSSMTGFVHVADAHPSNMPFSQQQQQNFAPAQNNQARFVPPEIPQNSQPKPFTGRGVSVGYSEDGKRPVSVLVQKREEGVGEPVKQSENQEYKRKGDYDMVFFI